MAVSISVNEASKGLYVAWRLLRRDRDAISLIDNTLEGVIKSYWCAAITLPFYAMFLVLEIGISSSSLGNISVLAEKAGVLNAFFSETIFYVLAWWVAWPLIMDRMAPWLGRDENFFRYIIAYNWSHAVRISILVAYMAMHFSGMIPDNMVLFAQLSVMVLLWTYHWFVLRYVLEVDGGTAGGLVAAEYIMIVMLSQATIAIAM